MRRVDRGFSFLELLVAISLATIILAMTLATRDSQKNRAGSEGLAQLLVAELRSARQQAMAQGSPVAICFPSHNASVPHAQSFYRLEGKAKGKMVAVSNLENDFPQGFSAIGYWGTDITIDRPGGEPASVNLESWLPDNFSDYAVVFSPSGAITSNSLPLSSGAYQVLACSAVNYSVTGPPIGTASTTKTPGYFEFSQVSAPHLISLRPSGQISLSDTVEGLQIQASPFAMPAEPAPAEQIVPVAIALPVVDSVQVFPAKPADETFSVVKRNGSLNLKVEASNSSGDDMSIEWQATPVAGASTLGGGFSMAGRSPMNWNTEENTWESEMTWTPPKGAQLGDTFALNCQVFTKAGASPVQQPTELQEVTVTEDEEIIVGNIKGGLFRVHTNGNGLQQIVSGTVYLRHPSASPDGTRIVWTDFINRRTHLRVASFDGTGVKSLFVGSSSNTSSFVSPVWNLASSRVYFGDSSRIRVASLDGSPMQTVTRDGDGNGTIKGLAVSSDQNYMAFLASGRRPDGVWSRDLYMGSLDRSVDPPRLVDVTNLTADTPKDWIGYNWRSGLCIRPNPTVPTEQTIVTLGETRAHGAGGVMYCFKVTDTGNPGNNRFTATKNHLVRTWPYASGFTFSRDGTKMAATPISGDLEIWDWQDGPTPRLVNKEEINLDASGLSNISYLTWR